MANSEEEQGRLHNWLDFAQKFQSTLLLEDLLSILLKSCMDLTKMQRSCVLLLDSGGNLQFRLGLDQRLNLLNHEDFKESEPKFIQCFEQKQEIYFDKIDQENPPVHKAFCIPLKSQQNSADKPPLGILYADSSDEAEFQEQEKESLNVLALHAAPVVEAAVLYEMAVRDKSTGVFKRHYFDAMAFVEWKRTLRHRHSLTVVIVQLEGTQQIKRDTNMRAIADAIKDSCRIEDIVACFEENCFIALLPETGVAGARRVSKRIVDHFQGASELILSIGAASYPHCAVNSIQDLVKLATTALGHARHGTTNRIVVYEPSLHVEHTKLFR